MHDIGECATGCAESAECPREASLLSLGLWEKMEAWQRNREVPETCFRHAPPPRLTLDGQHSFVALMHSAQHKDYLPLDSLSHTVPMRNSNISRSPSLVGDSAQVSSPAASADAQTTDEDSQTERTPN